VDETAFLAANPFHHTIFATGIVDVAARRLLDVVPGRSGAVLAQWISAQEPARRAGITVAALDPFRGYASALRTSLPDAVRVLDAFHLVRLGFAAVDDVRRRVQQETTGHRGRRDDPLYAIRRVLRRGAEHLSEHAWTRLLAGLDAGDLDQQIGLTWIAAQDLRRIYTSAIPAQAETRLYEWMVHCADSGVPELRRLATTIDSWTAEFLAYFTTGGISNGPTEAMNLLIKKIKRVSATDSATSTTTDSDYSCTAAWTGRLTSRHHSEPGYHAWLRRASLTAWSGHEHLGAGGILRRGLPTEDPRCTHAQQGYNHGQNPVGAESPQESCQIHVSPPSLRCVVHLWLVRTCRVPYAGQSAV